MKILNKLKGAIVLAVALFFAFAATVEAQQTSITIKDANQANQTDCRYTTVTNAYLAGCANLYVMGAPMSLSNPSFTAFVYNGAVVSPSNLLGVSPGPTESHLGEVGSHTITAVGTPFANPTGTTSYISTYLIANSPTAGSVTAITIPNACRVAGGSGMIRRGRLQTTDINFLGTIVRMHIHQSAPTFTNGDHAAWLTTSSGYLGDIDVTFNYSFSDVTQGVGSPNNGGEINYNCATGQTALFIELEARSTITQTGGGGTFTPSLELIEN